eukprot:5888408-Alexandrium_andersonii.AAC.1
MLGGPSARPPSERNAALSTLAIPRRGGLLRRGALAWRTGPGGDGRPGTTAEQEIHARRAA